MAIDSTIGGGDETLELAVFGFNPEEVRATARMNGSTVDEVVHSAIPAALVTGNLIDGAEPVLISAFARDTDGNGGLDRAVFFLSEPVGFLVTLTGSAIGAVDADELVVTMTLPLEFTGQCMGAMNVTAEQMPAFILRNPSIIQSDNPHLSIGDAPIAGLMNDGGTGHVDMFMLVGSPAHVMTGDGAIMRLYRQGPPGAGNNSNIGGLSFDFLPHQLPGGFFYPRGYTIKKFCSPPLGISRNQAASVSLYLKPHRASPTL